MLRVLLVIIIADLHVPSTVSLLCFFVFRRYNKVVYNLSLNSCILTLRFFNIVFLAAKKSKAVVPLS
jgi:hypothetical protein